MYFVLIPSAGVDDETIHESSVASMLSDEGLDLSQRINESIFAGPELDADGEEVILGEFATLSHLLDFCRSTPNNIPIIAMEK